jgi:hypothetical protein
MTEAKPRAKLALGDVLRDWSKYELDDSIYVPIGVEPVLDEAVSVLPFERARTRVLEAQHYLLGIEQLRDVVEGLERQLGRAATPNERLRAALHFARHDAFVDPRDAVAG